MIRMRLPESAAAHLRLACSPLWECVASTRVLADPARHALHLPWVRRARRRARGLDFSLLQVVVPLDGRYVARFVAPPPGRATPGFDQQLEEVRRTPAEVARREALRAYAGGLERPPEMDRFLREPTRAVQDLVRLLESYWARVLAPEWTRLAGLLEAELLHRSRELAEDGASGLLGRLHPSIRYDGRTIEVEAAEDRYLTLGDGLLLVPSVFAWPDVQVFCDAPGRPTLVFPARDASAPWRTASGAERDRLALLVGRARARVLRQLGNPATTVEVATRLGCTPGGASQVLGRLKDTGLVDRTRLGRRVYYELSTDGRALVDLLDPEDG